MPRKKNARRVILRDLRTLNRWFRAWTSAFDQSSKVYTGQREPDGRYWRTRERHEYIENDPAQLRMFAAQALDTAHALVAIARYAQERAREVEG